ncbi:unnamed protein product [Pedinophyceae sp. YPF-701]|nr:unnamed protein product [Pedinophyceae sp. YPF-701]
MGIAYPSEEQAIRGVKPAAFSARRDEPRTWTRVSPADLAAAARPADALDGVVRQRCALVRVRHSRVVVPHEALLKATGSRLSCAEALAVPSRPREGGWLRRFEGEVGGALRAAVGPQQPSTLRGPGGLEVGVDCEVDLPGEGPRGRCEGGVLVSLDLLAWTPRGAAASDAAARAITAGLARQMDDACCALLQATGHKLVGLAQPRGGAQQLPRAIAALHFAMREDAAAPSVGVVTGAFWLPGRAESPDEVAGARLLVRRAMGGSYLYLHYNCGGVDDRGWGCAYRSLQTLWSWYLLNHYTRRPVPTHREIQRMLVRLGDKPPAFEGSREWIGAVELSYVLQAELGVTCKILHAASGRDVPGLARELCAHFREHGTPCMVGGGVLAYTLLGAQWDSATPRGGSLLVLDPHWGAVDPGRRGAAVAGGWVAWRQGGDRCAAGNGPLFEPSCFYNILCPQRPSGP